MAQAAFSGSVWCRRWRLASTCSERLRIVRNGKPHVRLAKLGLTTTCNDSHRKPSAFEKAPARAHRIAPDPFVADPGTAPPFDGVVPGNDQRLTVRHERLLQQAKQDLPSLQARPLRARKEPMKPAEALVRSPVHRPQGRAHRAPVQAQQRAARQCHRVKP
jgi:hypothetical protein